MWRRRRLEAGVAGVGSPLTIRLTCRRNAVTLDGVAGDGERRGAEREPRAASSRGRRLGRDRRHGLRPGYDESGGSTDAAGQRPLVRRPSGVRCWTVGLCSAGGSLLFPGIAGVPTAGPVGEPYAASNSEKQLGEATRRVARITSPPTFPPEAVGREFRCRQIRLPRKPSGPRSLVSCLRSVVSLCRLDTFPGALYNTRLDLIPTGGHG